ncbi:hypothetical protein M5J20_06810 [Corynebacterium sp. TA-R-1]|uniref:Secreted protein n=1 Tax=Corynebacterium stercoris TaxID=2943490 RepID=A0ABT1G1N1_9CORY|nr:hypothetical protein [Corynebacterium stercoris]MCP1387900.1 hypothetical protein [Corynebacterium stercoris]
MKRKAVAAVVAAVGLLAGCSEKPLPDTATFTTTEAAASMSSSAPETTSAEETTVQTSAAKPSSAAAEPERGVPGAPLAYPGAGGPIPPNARPIRSVKSTTDGGLQYAVFRAPSENIGCMMQLEGEPMFDCGVRSLTASEAYGIGELGTPRWVAEVLHGYVREQTDPPLYYDEVWPQGAQPAEIVQYGEVVHHGPFVCAVEETGVTCWDSVSGRGAWLERESIVFF